MYKRIMLLLVMFAVFGYSKLYSVEPNLVAYYTFDEGSGTTLTDMTGRGNDGILTTYPLGGTPAQWKKGVNGYALEFDGDDYINLLNMDSGDLYFKPQRDAFSFTGWIKPNNNSVGATIISKQATDGNSQYRITLMSNGKISAYIGGPSEGVYTCADNSDFRGDGKWHFIAVTIPALTSGLKIYIDGVEQLFVSGTGKIGDKERNDIDVLIGANHANLNTTATNFFSGLIDEYKITTYI